MPYFGANDFFQRAKIARYAKIGLSVTSLKIIKYRLAVECR